MDRKSFAFWFIVGVAALVGCASIIAVMYFGPLP